jgi:hypothetical protein
MNAYRSSRMGRRWHSVAAGILALVTGHIWQGGDVAWGQRPSTDRHVREVGRYLNGVKVAAPISWRQLGVYPILVDNVPLLRGRWLTLDGAVAPGVLVVSEKGAGSVPLVRVENRSRDEYVFLMTGEVIVGGMQTRTIRSDIVLAPGQKIDTEVSCVEARRWSGQKGFSGGKVMLPQSIQGELRKGADQDKLWSIFDVARNNGSLHAENATGSLELALKAATVEDRLGEVRREIVPKIPRGTTGFVVLDLRANVRGPGLHSRGVGLELFGSEDLARQMLPKLLDSYSVDYVLLNGWEAGADFNTANNEAIAFFERVCRAGSERSRTPGSGAGLRTQEGGILGDGVSLDGVLAHYGVQVGQGAVPQPKPMLSGLLPHGLVGPDILAILHQPAVERVPGQRGAIADDQELPPGAGHGHVHPPHVAQESDLALRVGSHQRDHDRLLLAALKAVHAVDLQARHHQQLPQQPHLRCVRGDHGDVRRGDAGIQ